MATKILIMLVFFASIETGMCQTFFKELKKEQKECLKSTNIFDSYNLSKWYKRIVVIRKKYFKEIYNENFIYSDSLFICEYINIPNTGAIRGVIYDNRSSFYEYKFSDKYRDFSWSAIEKDGLIDMYKYSVYLHDFDFKQLKNDLVFSSPICDGNIIVLIKCIKNGASYKFQSIVFQSFNKHKILIE